VTSWRPALSIEVTPIPERGPGHAVRAPTEVFGTTTPASVSTKVAYGHPAMVLVNESALADLVRSKAT
jgi:hypothetical protein